jgi:hypothetical protein
LVELLTSIRGVGTIVLSMWVKIFLWKKCNPWHWYLVWYVSTIYKEFWYECAKIIVTKASASIAIEHIPPKLSPPVISAHLWWKCRPLNSLIVYSCEEVKVRNTEGKSEFWRKSHVRYTYLIILIIRPVFCAFDLVDFMFPETTKNNFRFGLRYYLRAFASYFHHWLLILVYVIGSSAKNLLEWFPTSIRF